VHLEDERPLKMAGLFDACEVAPDEWLHTFTILTTDSSKRLQWLVRHLFTHAGRAGA
jgi:putative SOS response-associated peptidase YedK